MKKLVIIAAMLLLGTAAQAQVLKIATIVPEKSEWMEGMRESAKQIKKRTDGRVQIKIYGGGIQGTDGQVLRKIRIGQLQGAAFTPAVLTSVYKDIVLYNMPMVFDNTDEVSYVRDRMDGKLMQGLEDAGFVSFGFAATGFSVILSNNPVYSASDLEGKKVWAPEDDPISEAALKVLGLNPIKLPLADVYTGLQTNLLEIMPGSPIGAIIMQWHTQVSHFTDLPLMYTVGLLAIDGKAFNRLKPEDQAVVREVMTDLYARYDEKNVIDDAKAKEALVNAGIERIVPDPAEMAEIRELVLASNLDLAEQGVFSLELYKEMLGYVAEYRGQLATGEFVADEDAETPAASSGQQ